MSADINLLSIYAFAAAAFMLFGYQHIAGVICATAAAGALIDQVIWRIRDG